MARLWLLRRADRRGSRDERTSKRRDAGVRMLLRQPGFTAIALLTLALEHWRHHRHLQRRERDRPAPAPLRRERQARATVREERAARLDDVLVAPANYVDWARSARTFESMVALTSSSAALTADQGPNRYRRLRDGRVLPGAQGSSASAGRSLPATMPRERRRAVIGHGLWRRRFGGDPATVGREITINDRPVTIVGVMKPGFGEGRPDTDLSLPSPSTARRASAEDGH